MTKPQMYIAISLQSENQAIKLGEIININHYFFSRTLNIKSINGNTYWGLFKITFSSNFKKLKYVLYKNKKPNKERTQKTSIIMSSFV